MSWRPWMSYVSIGLALCLFGAAIASTPFAPLVLLFAGISFVVAAVIAFRSRRDPYDLDLLRDVHEREIARNIDVPDPEEGYDSFLCVYCGNTYSTEFRTCPKCGKGCG